MADNIATGAQRVTGNLSAMAAIVKPARIPTPPPPGRDHLVRAAIIRMVEQVKTTTVFAHQPSTGGAEQNG